MISAEEALSLILENTKLTDKSQKIELLQSKGYVLAEDIATDRDYPPFHRSTMDGYAVHSSFFDSDQFEEAGSILAGSRIIPPYDKNKRQACRIMTGAAVPEHFDTVVRIEDTQTDTGDGKTHVRILKLPKPGANIARRGEDALRGRIIAYKNSLIGEPVLSAAAGVGKTELLVRSLPRISLISTGDEIVKAGATPEPNQIRDSNSVCLRSHLLTWNILPQKMYLCPDDPEILLEKVRLSLDADFLIVSGGVSMGDADWMPGIFEKVGAKKIFHGAAIRPGKPLWFGKKENTLIFGVPGNPFSCSVAFKIFIEESIRRFLGLEKRQRLTFPLGENRRKKHPLTEYFRAKLSREENQTRIYAVPHHGSGDFISSIESGGLGVHPADREEICKNDWIEFISWDD